MREQWDNATIGMSVIKDRLAAHERSVAQLIDDYHDALATVAAIELAAKVLDRASQQTVAAPKEQARKKAILGGLLPPGFYDLSSPARNIYPSVSLIRPCTCHECTGKNANNGMRFAAMSPDQFEKHEYTRS